MNDGQHSGRRSTLVTFKIRMHESRWQLVRGRDASVQE